jgi:autotransporter passenger strand-loop-strand repeat protein
MEELLLENKWATIHSGTTVNSAVVNSGGGLIVSSGGTASEILENGGYVVVEEGAEVSFIPNTFSGLILSSLSATVHSVTNATDITVMSSGSLIVFSGGTANHLTAISGGSLTVSSGGMANHMTVNYGSLGIIGGTVNDVTVNEGDLRVYKGGTVNHVTCYGSLFIDKYGTVTDATINPRGSATVYTGGTANHTTVNSGLLDVRGGTVNDVTVNGGGRLIIYKGGTATEIKENGGYVEITSGADVSFVPNTIYGLGFSGGSGVPMPISSATIHSGTTAIYTTLYLTSGNLTIFSGGTANGTTVGGRMTISEGGVATHTALCNGSLGIIGGSADITLVQGYNDISMFVSNGGTADHTIITRGTLEVGKRGTANSTVVAGNGAVFTVHYGGTANGVTVNSGGSVNVNGKLTGRIVSLNGGLISANGTLDFDLNQVSPGNGARINNLSCISGNLVYTITVNADQAEGIYTLANDASAFDQTITVVNVAGETLGTLTVGETTAISGIDYTLSLSDGTLSLTVGTTVTPSPYTSDGLILSNRSTTIKQGEVFHDTVLVSGSLVIKSGGLADNVMVWSGGKVTVSSGGEINSAIVNKNCRLEARSGGTAHNIIVNEGGCATGIVLNNGDNLTVFSSGSAYAVVNDGGCLYVFNGGSAGATVNSGGLVNGITLDSKSSSYSPLIVSSGGTAVFTTINKSGSLIASGGAHLERTYVNSGGSLHISDGVVANNTVISGKSGLKDYSVFQNSNYSSATNSGYGVLELHSGGIMNNTSVFIGGILVINSGGLANNTIVSGSGDIRHRSNYGSLVVSNGGMARNITIERGGSVTILTNGEADGITLSSGGSLSVLGGTATNVVWTPGSGYLTIFSGAVVSFASEYYGVYYGSYSSGRLSRAMAMESKPFGSNNFMYVMSGGTVSNIDQKGGEIHVWSGGTASTIRAGAGDLRISSGGTATFSASHSSYIFFDVASDTYVQGTSNGIAFEMKDAYLSGYIADNHNYIFVSSGGVAENTTLNSGLLYVCSSGTAKNTFVNSRGWLEVFSGGTLTGKVSLKWGGYYSMFEGAVLDFDLTQTEAGEVALVNDLSLIQGTPLYTLTVSDTQASGTYTLAEGASMFKGTLTVQNVSGEELGTLTVGGELETENRRYALSLEDDRLWLTCYALSTGRIIEKTVTVNAYEIYREPIVNSGGRLNVSSGGTATGIMENGGFVYIEDGADVSFIPNTISGLIISQGSATVHSGTKAVGVTVNSRGSMYVFSGGTALEIMENGGYVEVVDGADVSFKSNTISWMVCEAPATIHSGTTANSATISGGCLYISSGGTANNTLNRGSMVVFSGGIANSTTINDGSMRVSSGGIAFKTMVKGHDHSPEVHVLSSGTAENVLVYENGDLHIASGGKLTGRIICLGNTETLECGMVALDDGAIVDFDLTHSLPGAAARINNLSCFGGVTSRWPRDLVYTLTVNADQIEGIYRLADQADVFHQTITVVNKAGEELGTISLDETTIISNVSYTLDLSDQVLSLKIGENNTPSPYTSDGLILSNYANVVNNEIYHDTLIIAGGRLEISSGGTANVIMIGSGGKTEVNTSGNANNTEISSNGHMDVFSGGSVSNTEVHSGGRFTISSGGTANRTIINSGVSFVVGNGVKAFEIVENGGYVDVKAGADVTFASNSYSNLFLYRASATVHSGTTAVSTFVSKDARFHIFSGGMADSTLILQGSMFVYSDGMADNTEIYDRSRLIVSSGGIAKNTIVNSNADFVIDGIANDTTVNSGGGMGVVGVANNIAVSCGEVDIYSGGMANNTIILGDSKCMAVVEVSHSGIANNTSVNQYGSMLVSSGGTANFTTVNSGGEITIKLQGIANVTTIGSGGGVSVVESGGIVNSANVCSGGSLSVYANAKLTGQMTFAEGAVVSARQRAILDFDISGLTPEAGARVNNLALIQGTPTYTLTVGGDLKQGIYTYLLAGGAEDFASTITVVDQAGDKLGVLTVGETVRIGYDDYTLNLTDGTLSVTVEVPDLTPTETQGTSEQVSWEATGANSYIVEYSTDSFEHVIQVVATGNAIDSPELPAGNYQWRVKADANSEWAIGEAIVSEVDPSMPKVVQSNADDNDDLFFANPVGTWDDCSFALHVGSINDWTGTNEIISASGKGRIQNLFFGSSDPNVLCLTDGENGDAIFVDDVYTDLPEGIEEHTARLYKIQEVRAGFGDDIVDMTSQRFEYFGEGLTIRGGAGNDTIWANKGNNMLFGDAGNDRIVGASGNDIIAGGIGNDRMHGGGGNDIFTFGENWGVDTVEQLATGSVTLWFVSGDESNWNAETMTYTDGDNSVTVTGVTSVELRFGNNTTEQYTMLAQAGAFLDFTTERIFEEAGKGVLASL